MGKVYFFTGTGLIGLSGILYTLERFFAVYIYASENHAVRLNGNGSVRALIMPGIFDNLFVGLLFILGIVLFVFGTYKLLTIGKKEK
ncbi:hypothetical protein [Aquibacillus sediminis]|uniref:hypothetical protein n=1 Tax=Aquibacillus sediminis TaxID=2574734 RepID=UPI0011095A3B|nr:hypothetical protein [Aquibacillus sediminis]